MSAPMQEHGATGVDVRDVGERVLRIEAAAIEAIAARLDTTFDEAVSLVAACRGRVVVMGLGMTCVVDGAGGLLGLITDGDLRRAFMREGEVLRSRADQVMTSRPVTVGTDARVSEVMDVMERHRITCVPAVDEQGRVRGVVHIHDLWSVERR